MKRERRTEVLAVAMGAALLACSPSPPPEPRKTSVAQQPLGEPEPGWSINGRPTVDESGDARYTLLPDGTVLVASPAGAELYDPASGQFTLLDAAAHLQSAKSQAVVLRSGIVAFFGDSRGDHRAVEFYDPAARTFSAIDLARDLERDFGVEKAVLLRDGNVLVKVTEGACGGATSCLRVFDAGARKFGALIRIDSSYFFTLTVLPSGKVLLAGRGQRAALRFESALLFDPSTGQLDDIGFMLHPRLAPVVTLLPNGRVLFCGGLDFGAPAQISKTCEYYDPVTNAFVEGPYSSRVSNQATMIVLPSGQVMAVGGGATPEVLDVGGSAFRPLRSLAFGRSSFPSVLVLPSGKVLVGGGTPGAPIETYDPGMVSLSVTQVPSAQNWVPVSAALPDGGVLLCGDPASIYDPLADTFKALNLSCDGTATVLPSGRVLVVSGGSHAEIVDPGSGVIEKIPSSSRQGHNATVLSSGAVLVTGGGLGDNQATSAELFEPAQNRFVALPNMKTARSGAVSALLGSGKVLIAGGNGDPMLPSSELFDPTQQAFVALRATPIALQFPMVAVTLASGDSLIGAMGSGWARFAAKTETFAPLAELIHEAGAGAALLTADRLFCDWRFCIRYDEITGRFVESFPHDLVVDPENTVFPVVVASATGLIVAFNGTSAARVWPFPPDAVRPVLDAVPQRLASVVPVTLTGSRFTRPSAVGAEAMPPLDRHPLVAFVPVSGGGPVFSLVTEWTDSTLTWIAPRTVFRGAGWVHVYVDGVPSLGRFTVLDASPKGVSCSTATECGTGHCVDKVCCDGPCNGDCESCLAENQKPGGIDGTCAAIREGLDPRDKCTVSLCGGLGSCDGQGECALVAENAPCTTPGNQPGVCNGGGCFVSSTRCTPDGELNAVNGETRSCAPYVCRSDRCASDCDSVQDCAAGYLCTSKKSCSRCTPEADGVESGASPTERCFPYLCRQAECARSCVSRADCAPGFRCNGSQCVPGAAFAAAVDSGACSVAKQGSRSRSLVWLLPLLGWLVRRRRSAARLRGAAT